LTYRVYDYGRVDAHGKPRELHVEKALEVMNFGHFDGGRVAPLKLPTEGGSKALLAACRYFAAERWEFRATVQTQSAAARFELFVILAGSGYIHWRGSPLMYEQGQCWLIPASLGKFSLQPEQCTFAIRTYVPDLVDLASELHASGFSDAQLSSVIFA
jgi:mannose-6-phosphate isomerase